MSDLKGDKMDMSLDDIIQLNRKSGGSGRGRNDRNDGGFQRRGGGGRSGGGGQFQRRRSDGGSGRGPRGGGVQRRSDGASAGVPYSRPRQVPDVWKHDLYEESSNSAARPAMPPPRSLQRDADKRSPKLIISNLDFGVNDQDIQELFGEFGTLRRFAVHYDKSGRSLGTADVEYDHMAEAIKAMKQYNNVPLDGKPMKIELEGDTGRISSDRPRTMSSRLGQASQTSNGVSNNRDRDFVPRRRQSFENNDRRNQGRGRRGQGQRGRGQGQNQRGRGGRDQGPVVSKEDLDAELDAYNAKMDTE